MADTIFRSRAALSWANGGPGVNTWYWTLGVPPFADPQEGVDEMNGLINDVYLGLRGSFPSDVAVEVQELVDEIEITTGYIVAQWNWSTPSGTIVGTGAGTGTSRASQIVANLGTDIFKQGRRLRGRHFLGPIASSAISSGGYVSSTLLSSIPNLYSGMTSGIGTRLAVYHRPKTLGDGSGYYGDVQRVDVKENPGILRSRRD